MISSTILLFDVGLGELKNFAPTIIIVMIAAYVVLRTTPTRKEIRFRELDSRDKEIAAQVEIAVAVTKLADVSEKIAIEQRQATEVIEVAQRVNVNSNEKLTRAVDDLMHTVEGLNDRMDRVETATGAAAGKGTSQ